VDDLCVIDPFVEKNIVMLKRIKKYAFALFRGPWGASFYFQSINISDSMLALLFALLNAINVSGSRKGRHNFIRDFNLQYCFDNVFLFGSGRSALYSLLVSLGMEENDEVIITGYTCDVVANAIIQAKLKPVYVDIDLKNYCMSPKSVENSIGRKTKVIIIQHTYGIPADLDVLLDIAERHSLYVIEDCAVSLGSRYKGRLTGTFGDAAIFSFELSKTITSCRGGLLGINSSNKVFLEKMRIFYSDQVPEQSYTQRINILLQLGISGISYHPRIFPLGKYVIATLFKLKIFSYSTSNEEKMADLPLDYLHKLSNEQAIILRRQLARLYQVIECSQRSMEYYFDSCSKILPDGFTEYVRQNEVCMIRFPISIKNREKYLYISLKNKIEVGLWFTAPLTSPKIQHDLFEYKMGQCPTSEALCDKIINLPLHRRVRIEDRMLYSESLLSHYDSVIGNIEGSKDRRC
jgi:perosamine synthetase